RTRYRGAQRANGTPAPTRPPHVRPGAGWAGRGERPPGVHQGREPAHVRHSARSRPDPDAARLDPAVPPTRVWTPPGRLRGGGRRGLGRCWLPACIPAAIASPGALRRRTSRGRLGAGWAVGVRLEADTALSRWRSCRLWSRFFGVLASGRPLMWSPP